MMRVTVKHIQRLDQVAIDRFGVPSLILMENAGRAVAAKAPKGKRVCILCGTGNNGGDGFVAGRHLLNAGVKVDIVVIGRAAKLKNDPLANYFILKRCGYPVLFLDKMNKKILNLISKADVIIDALFGVGLNRRLGEPFLSLVEAINRSKKYVVAIDIPSGLDGTTGKIYGACVRANKTITFTFAKRGFYKREGPRYVGKVVVADIGIPRRIISRFL